MMARIWVGIIITVLIVGISVIVIMHQKQEINMQEEGILLIMALFPQNTDQAFYFVLRSDGTLLSAYGNSRRARLRRADVQRGAGHIVNLRRRNFMRYSHENSVVILSEDDFENVFRLIGEAAHQFSTDAPPISFGGWNVAFLYEENSFEMNVNEVLQLKNLQALFDKILHLSQLPALCFHGWARNRYFNPIAFHATSGFHDGRFRLGKGFLFG